MAYQCIFKNLNYEKNFFLSNNSRYIYVILHITYASEDRRILPHFILRDLIVL